MALDRLTAVGRLVLLLGLCLGALALATPSGTAPEITYIDFPTTIQADGNPVTGYIFFADPDGDVVKARFELLEGDRDSLQLTPGWEFDPGVKGETEGVIEFQLAATAGGDYKLKATLEDEAGNTSEPSSFGFEALAVEEKPPSGECTVTVEPGQSIQQAINSAAEGAVICLAAGTYEENLTITKGLTLRGEGGEPKDVRIVGVKEGYPVIRIESDSEIEVNIEKLTAAEAKGVFCAEEKPQWICPDGIQALGKAKVTVNNTVVSGNGHGFRVRGSASVSLSNSTVSGNGAGLSVWDSASVSLSNSTVSDNENSLEVCGPWFKGARNCTAQVTLTNSTVSDNEYGLVVGNSATVSLRDSTVSGNRWSGLSVGDLATVSLRDSTVSGNGWNGLSVGDSASVSLENNTIQNNRRCGIRSSSDKAVQGERNRMSGNGADLCGNLSARLREPLVPEDPTKTELSFPGPYPSLQATIDALAPGGTITIASGEHQGGLTIWKPLRLRGAGRGRTKIVGAVSLIDEAQRVQIEGVTITGSAFDGLLLGGQAQATITDSQVSGNEDDGLIVGGSARVSLSNSTVSDNEYGLVVWGSTRVSLTDSTISGNRGHGLSVGGSATVSLTNSTVSGNRWDYIGDGLVVWDSATVSLTSSTVSDNRLAVSVWDSATVSLTNSTVSDNGLAVRVGDSASVSLTNSTVSDNRYRYGLWVEDSATVEVRSSTIEGNGTDEDCQEPREICNGLLVADKAHVELTRTTIRKNTDWGIAAFLKKCGYDKDNFTGQVTIDEATVIEGNNTSGNQDGMGNPGDHPWNRPEVPDGQVCLP